MSRVLRSLLLLVLGVALSGCSLRDTWRERRSLNRYLETPALAREPDVRRPSLGPGEGSVVLPMTINGQQREVWFMDLDEAIQLALTHNIVLNPDQLLNSSQGAKTILDPGLAELHPQTGVVAAVTVFDPRVSASVFSENNDRVINNRFQSTESGTFKQDYLTSEVEVSKRAPTGAEFFFRTINEYDANNATGNIFPSRWTAIMELEARQPLLRGAGVGINRLQRPFDPQGAPNGVLIARLGSDTTLAQFEANLRDLLSNVENAYWELYFAYRLLEAKVDARDATRRTLEVLRAQGALEAGADKEARAERQFLTLDSEVVNALGGRIVEGTRTNNGSQGGTFRGMEGVYVAERRLRLLLGLPINDERIIRPAHDPPLARVKFDWQEVASEALERRAELRQQRLQVRRRELELLAARNYLLPELELVAAHRFRGFGKDLLRSNRAGRAQFDDAWGELLGGDFQETHLGIEFNMPAGNRAGYGGVRFAQLRLNRERAVLEALERQVLFELSNAYHDVDRAFEYLGLTIAAREAARREVAVLEEKQQANEVDINLLLQAYRERAQLDTQFFRALMDYLLSIKNVHYEKGSLLDYNNVALSGHQTNWTDGLDLLSSWSRGGDGARPEYRQQAPPAAQPVPAAAAGPGEPGASIPPPRHLPQPPAEPLPPAGPLPTAGPLPPAGPMPPAGPLPDGQPMFP